MSLVTSLGEVWAGAITAWVLPELSAVPIYNAPLGGPWKYEPLAFPRPAVFELTAFNPALSGVHLSVSENFAALEELKQRVAEELGNSCLRFPTFGFDASGYREDGVGVACEESRRDAVRKFLVEVGREFGQGAIYEFRREDERALRVTVPCDVSFNGSSAEVEVKAVVPPVDWTGGWKSQIWHPTKFYRNDL